MNVWCVGGGYWMWMHMIVMCEVLIGCRILDIVM